jgi:hypothetical protein
MKYLEQLSIHTGTLGDIFVLSGAIRHFAEEVADKVYVLTRDPYLSIVKDLYSDSDNIVIHSYSEQPYPQPILKSPDVFFTTPQHIPPIWDEQFYAHYNLPFAYRYTKFRIPSANTRLQSPNEKYILTSTNFRNTKITFTSNSNLKVIDLTEELAFNPLDFIYLIENAEEIHCVPSSIFCLVDSIRPKKPKLFYHDIRIDTVMRVNNSYNKHWNIVPYARKL